MSARDDLAFLARVDAALKSPETTIEQKAQDVIALVLERLKAEGEQQETA